MVQAQLELPSHVTDVSKETWATQPRARKHVSSNSLYHLSQDKDCSPDCSQHLINVFSHSYPMLSCHFLVPSCCLFVVRSDVPPLTLPQKSMSAIFWNSDVSSTASKNQLCPLPALHTSMSTAKRKVAETQRGQRTICGDSCLCSDFRDRGVGPKTRWPS